MRKKEKKKIHIKKRFKIRSLLCTVEDPVETYNLCLLANITQEENSDRAKIMYHECITISVCGQHRYHLSITFFHVMTRACLSAESTCYSQYCTIY